MSYTSGTLSSSTSTPGADLLSQLESMLTSHANWDYVQDVTISGSTYRVWKNRGSGTGANSFGQDFYVHFRVDSSQNLNVSASEGFVTASGNVIRPVAGSSAGQALNSNGSFGDETNGLALNSSSVPYAYVQTAAATPYYISVTSNRICLASGAGSAFYAGLFDSLLPNEPFPLCITATSGMETFYYTADGGTSRQPGKSAGNTDAYNFCHKLSAWTVTSGDTQTIDIAIGAPLASRVLLAPTQQNPTTYGTARGLLYDCFYLPNGANATRNGDTMTVGSDVYVKMKFGTSNLIAGVWVNTAV